MTGFILVMPLGISLSSLLKSRKVDFKAALERNRIAVVAVTTVAELVEATLCGFGSAVTSAGLVTDTDPKTAADPAAGDGIRLPNG